MSFNNYKYNQSDFLWNHSKIIDFRRRFDGAIKCNEREHLEELSIKNKTKWP